MPVGVPDVVQLHLLGPVSVTRPDGGDGALLTAPRRLAVLAYLAIARPRGLHSRETLIALLWPEAGAANGRHALRNVLHAIRQALGDEVIVTAGDGLVGVNAAMLDCDVLALEDDLANDRADAALGRYQGELLQGFHISEAPDFERWLDTERRRLLDATLDAAWSRALACRLAGDMDGALAVARRASGLAPDDERALRRLLELFGDVGDHAAAERAFVEFAERLEQEYGVAPAPETKALMDRVRARRAPPFAAREISSLAVLSFAQGGGVDDGDDFCDALSTALISRLARVPRFSVRAPIVVARYRTDGTDPLIAGRELGVDAVVIANVTARSGERPLDVRVEIIRVTDGALLHGETFCARREELFSLQDGIARAICRALEVTPSDEETRVLPTRPTLDDEAYVLYVRGTYLFLRAIPVGDASELNRSLAFFEQALERDPNFAHAYAGLANYYAVAAVRNVLRPFDETFARAIEYSRRALAIDSTLAIPHVHFGVKAMYLDGDWEKAGAEFAMSVALEPSYAEARKFYGIYLGAMGRTSESMHEFREAVRVEPHLALYRNSIAAAQMALGANLEAIDGLRQALTIDPMYGAAHERLIRCYERVGRYEDAVAERRRDDRAGTAQAFANALNRDGANGYLRSRDVELRAMIESTAGRLTDGPPENAADILNPPQLRLALACAELGEWDRARAWEEHACSRRPGQRQWFIAHPELAPIHDGSAFKSAQRVAVAGG